MLHLHCCSSALFLMYHNFFCKWKILPCWQKNNVLFQVNPQLPYFPVNKPQISPLPWLEKGSRARVCSAFPSGASNLLQSSSLQGGEGDEKFTIKLADNHQVEAVMMSQRLVTNSLLVFFFLHLSLDHFGEAQTPKNTLCQSCKLFL